MAIPNPQFNCPTDTSPNVDPVTGKYVPPEQCIGTLDLSTTECANNDSKYIETLGAEALNIAAGPVHIFPLLGIHNQGTTIDLTGEGYPLSSGTAATYNVLDAFDSNVEPWRSSQFGAAVMTAPAFIGYNFGTKTTDSGVDRNAPPAPIKYEIRTIKLKQSSDPTRRASQVRVEASNDGITWLRIDVINLTNVADLVTYGVKGSAMYQQWRLVALMFNGAALFQPWEVVELQLLNDNQLSLSDVQDKTLMENRDRAYSQTSVCVKATYDLLDVQTELARFGIDLPKQYIFTINFNQMVSKLGRPIVIGDIVELPGETQYDTQLRPIRQWLEVTDATWSTEGYTPNWRPTLFRFFAQPLLPSQEHRDILGVPNDRKAQTDDEFLSGAFGLNVQAFEATEAIIQEASEKVPERGSDAGEFQSGTNMHGVKGSDDQRDLYVEDGLPKNGEPFTEGESFPASPTDGDYHRLTYAANLKIPARLMRWNAIKNRWILLEQDRRGQYESHRPTMSRFMKSATKANVNENP